MDEQPIFPVVVFPVLHIFDLIISLWRKAWRIPLKIPLTTNLRR
jgi:hypothetical protein